MLCTWYNYEYLFIDRVCIYNNRSRLTNDTMWSLTERDNGQETFVITLFYHHANFVLSRV